MRSLRQPTPQAGQWEITTDMKGAPFGGGAKTGNICIKAETWAQGREKALMEAAAKATEPSNSSREKPKCTYSDTQREAEASKWKSSCTASRGQINGTGSGTFTQENAQITQQFEVNSPFGKRIITETIAAKRIGECT
jgi:Protein of unknown function (DUF3617)